MIQHPTTPATGSWKAALVADDVFFGPYPALVHDRTQGTVTARFRLDVIEQMAADLARLADSHPSTIVTVSSHRMVILTDRAGGSRQLQPDSDGLYTLDAPWCQWSVVEAKWRRDGECECGERRCPAVCYACDAPVLGPHHDGCVWLRGSAPWEKPVIPASPVVLEAHIHWIGCVGTPATWAAVLAWLHPVRVLRSARHPIRPHLDHRRRRRTARTLPRLPPGLRRPP